MKLLGCNAIITGASQGFGLEVAKYFLQEGASVALCARDAQKLAQAKEQLLPYVCNSAKLLVSQTDISKPDQMSALVDLALNEFNRIDILVANAGIYGPKGSIDEIDWDEWSQAIDINLKGTVLQCRAVLPHMKKQQHGKIIILSGGGATKPMPNLSAYAASKAAVVRFAETLAEEVRDYHIDVNTIAPGALNTRLLDEILEAGPEKVGEGFYAQSVKQKQNGGAGLEVGARLCVFLAAQESNGITGRLISAVWDPWEHLAAKTEYFKTSDIYTLRRIVPEDRGQDWTNLS
jgi:NAD(P)-dependent dehydrogenase (short-subunit alcohol dehydrogenase family)